MNQYLSLGLACDVCNHATAAEQIRYNETSDKWTYVCRGCKGNLVLFGVSYPEVVGLMAELDMIIARMLLRFGEGCETSANVLKMLTTIRNCVTTCPPAHDNWVRVQTRIREITAELY